MNAPVSRSSLQAGALDVTITINGQAYTAKIDPRILLVEFIREVAGLTGTHVGCDTSQCGACVVHVDGHSVKSCTMFAAQADGGRVETVEGLCRGDALHPLQAAFTECHALQCGYCTPGMLMSGLDLINRNPHASEHEIRDWLDGNLCRCTGYGNIVRAIAVAADAMTGRAPGRAQEHE
ncbi:MAG TPA: (2Fe-2S)-binding protein [Burkholderiaceae bacterium]|nr:(2Fe-2S)-binding protein [Burkholderiaceae bacterium]